MDETVKIFKALGDRNRLRILKILQRRSLCVCEITEVVGLSTSTVSNHLNILRNAGLITDSKEGKWVNYFLNRETENPHVQAIFSLLSLLLNEDPQVKADYMKVEKVDRMTLCAS